MAVQASRSKEITSYDASGRKYFQEQANHNYFCLYAIMLSSFSLELVEQTPTIINECSQIHSCSGQRI
jgi:hypothetical protein